MVVPGSVTLTVLLMPLLDPPKRMGPALAAAGDNSAFIGLDTSAAPVAIVNVAFALPWTRIFLGGSAVLLTSRPSNAFARSDLVASKGQKAILSRWVASRAITIDLPIT